MKGSDPLGKREIEAYLNELSSEAPTPGGGSASAIVAAIAASLGLMVAAVGNKGQDDPRLSAIADRLADLRTSFLRLATEDEEAFRGVLASYRLPEEDPKRDELIEQALKDAADVPLRLAGGCIDLLDRLIELVPLSSRQIASDIGAASHLARGALDAALFSVTANIAYMHDQKVITETVNERDRLASLGGRLVERISSLVAERIG